MLRLNWKAALLCCGLCAQGAAALAVDARLQVMAAGCAACHGTYPGAQDGQAQLAGGNAQSFLQRMLDFKTGRKTSIVMGQIAKGYSDDQIRHMADYFEGLRAR